MLVLLRSRARPNGDDTEDRQDLALTREIIVEIEQYGLSDERCMFNNCSRPALKGIKFCGRHILRQTDDELAPGLCCIALPSLAGRKHNRRKVRGTESRSLTESRLSSSQRREASVREIVSAKLFPTVA